MSSDTVSITVSSRPGKRAMKNLPPTIEISGTTTVEDAKKEIAKAIRMRDYNRIAILEPTKQSIIKNRKALLKDEKNVMQSQEIMVKDLGRQISWQNVFLIEYIGPILIHFLFILARPWIYSNTASNPLSTAQIMTAVMIILHFIKREFETLYIHKFSNSTMPFFNVYKNSAHYWILAGFNIAYWVYSPDAWAAIPGYRNDMSIVIGTLAYITGEVMNLYTHVVLSNLRTPGGTERGIPQGIGFDVVTCPNYMFEALAWAGILLVSRSIGTLLFVAIAIGQMQVWAEGKEKALRKEFGDKYTAKAFPMIPNVPFLFSRVEKKMKKIA